jgi:hypothetical protein
MDLRARLAALLLALACAVGGVEGLRGALDAARRGSPPAWRLALDGKDGLSRVDALVEPALFLVPPDARVGVVGPPAPRRGPAEARFFVARYALAPRDVVDGADAPFTLVFAGAALPPGFELAADLGDGLRLARRRP